MLPTNPMIQPTGYGRMVTPHHAECPARPPMPPSIVNTTIAPTPIAMSTKAKPKSQRYRLLPKNIPAAAKPLPGRITNAPSNGSTAPTSSATPPATKQDVRYAYSTHHRGLLLLEYQDMPKARPSCQQISPSRSHTLDWRTYRNKRGHSPFYLKFPYFFYFSGSNELFGTRRTQGYGQK